MALDAYHAFASRVGQATEALERSFLADAPSWQAGPALAETRHVLGQQAQQERPATECLHAFLQWPPDGSKEPNYRVAQCLDVLDISDGNSMPKNQPHKPMSHVHSFPCVVLLESVSTMLCGASTSVEPLMKYVTAAVECALRRRRHAPNRQAPAELVPLDRAMYEFLDKDGSQWSEESLLPGIQANHPDTLPVVLAALSSLGVVIRVLYRNQKRRPSHVQLGEIGNGGKYIYLTVQRLPSESGETTLIHPGEAGGTAELPGFQSTFQVLRLVANIRQLQIGGVEFLAPELKNADYSAFREAFLVMPTGSPISTKEFQGPDTVRVRGSFFYKLSLEEMDGSHWWQLKRRDEQDNQYYTVGHRVLAEPLPLTSAPQLPRPQVALAARRSRRLGGRGPTEVDRGQPSTSEVVSGPRQNPPGSVAAAQGRANEVAGRPSVQQQQPQGRPADQQQQHPVEQVQNEAHQQQATLQPSSKRAGPASTSQSQPHKKARLEGNQDMVEWTKVVYDKLDSHFETHEQLDELLQLELTRDGTEGSAPASPGRLHLTSHLAELRSWLQSPAVDLSPSVAAITGMPGVGKSRIVSEIIELVLKGLPDPEGQPPEGDCEFEPIPWEKDNEALNGSSDTGPGLIYDETQSLPHLDEVPKGHPWRSREELRGTEVSWLCSSDLGNSLSAVPTYIGFHEEDNTSIFVELHLRTHKEKEEAMLDAEGVEAGSPEEEDNESPEDADKKKKESISMQKARSLLGMDQTSTASLPPRAERRVPALLKHKIHKYRFDRRHPLVALKLNRLQYRNTCKGYWGHYHKAVIIFPGPPKELPMLLDTPGAADRLLPYAMDNIKDVLKSNTLKTFATVLVVKQGRSEASSGDTIALLEALSVPSCMAKPTDVSPVPVHVHVACNIMGKERGLPPLSKEDFFEGTHDGTAGYQTLVPNRIKEAHGHTEEEKQLMLHHSHAYPLFLFKDLLQECIIAEDHEEMREYELSGFWLKLIKQWEDAKQAHNKVTDQETLRKLQLVFSQMWANVLGSDTSNDSLADACGLYAEVIRDLHSHIEILVLPCEQSGIDELRGKVCEAQGTLSGLLSQCSTEAVKGRIDQHKHERFSGNMRKDLHGLCHKGNRNIRKAMEKPPLSSGVNILVFGSELTGPSIASVVVSAARHVFQGYLSELSSSVRGDLVQRFESMLQRVDGSAIAKLKDVQRGLYAGLEARIQDLMAKMEEELQSLASSEDLFGKALKRVMTPQLLKFANRRTNPEKLDAIAREAPNWGKALVEWYTDQCNEKWKWVLERWQELFGEALAEIEQVLTGIIQRSPDSANNIDGPHVQACKATMHEAAQLMCQMHAALASRSSLGQLPPCNSNSADVASTSAASASTTSTSGASAGHNELLEVAQEVVRRGQEHPQEFGLPSTEIDELVQEKRRALMPLPNHEGNYEVPLPALPSFKCGCCKQRHDNRMSDRRKVASLYEYLARLGLMRRRQTYRQALLRLCGEEGDMCRFCYDKIKKMKKEEPSKSMEAIWAEAKSRRKTLG